MGLTNRKEEQLKRMPTVQSIVKTSRNGKYLISQTVITSVKPIEYYRAVIANSARPSKEPLTEDELVFEDSAREL